MNRRTFLSAILATPALAALAAACGDDSTSSSRYEFSKVPDEVVLRISYEGGFVGPGALFSTLPAFLLTGNGRAFSPGAMIDIYPGPLLSPMFERSVSTKGIEKVLKLADDAGLLGEIPDYELPDGPVVMDAPDTVVRIAVNGKLYEHRANALGMGLPDDNTAGDTGARAEVTPARDNLLKFVTLMNDVSKVAGAGNVGDEGAWVPDQYRFQAMAVDPTQWTDPAPTVVEWPIETGVVLADSAQCAKTAATEVDELFANATQLTFFKEGDVVYQLAVVGVLPGDALC
jgi:hypothetical protein